MAKRIKVSALALVLLASGVLAVCGDRSAAEPLTHEFTDQRGGWKARANFDSNGKLTSCLALRVLEFGKEADVKLGIMAQTTTENSRGFVWFVDLQSRNEWPLGEGKPLLIDVAFDGQAPHHLPSVGSRSDLMFPLPLDLDSQFRKWYTMSVSVEGRRFEFNLAGTYRLLPVLKDCVRTYASSGTPLDAAPVAVRPDATSDSPATFYGNENVDFRIFPQNTLKSAVGNPTPLAIPGAATVTTMELKKAMDAGRPMVLIDALGGEHATTIKGAVSLPHAGDFGTFHDEVQTRLANALNGLLQGRTDVTLVFFCEGAKCWESYNAALRAHAAGFQNISWYRGGLRAWKEAGFPMQPNQ